MTDDATSGTAIAHIKLTQLNGMDLDDAALELAKDLLRDGYQAHVVDILDNKYLFEVVDTTKLIGEQNTIGGDTEPVGGSSQ